MIVEATPFRRRLAKGPPSHRKIGFTATAYDLFYTEEEHVILEQATAGQAEIAMRAMRATLKAAGVKVHKIQEQEYNGKVLKETS